MSSLINKDYIAARLKNNTYGLVASQICRMGPAALANAQLNVDFVRTSGSDSDASKGHYFYVSKDITSEDGKPVQFTANLFGEIQSPTAGTELCAKGTFNATFGDKTISDSTTVRDKLVLGLPTAATPTLEDLYLNQLAVLDEVMETDMRWEKERNERYAHNEWLTDDGKGIIVKLPSKYAVPESQKESRPSTSGTQGAARRERNKRKRDDEPSAKAEKEKENANLPGQHLELGGFVDPHVLPDYGGQLFQHKKARLVVHDMRHPDNSLIHPADMYDTLRTGTLVIVNATFAAWAMDRNGIKNRYYTISVNKLKVLASSTEPVDPRDRPVIKKPFARPPPAPAGSQSMASFDDFETPASKKRRTTTSTF